MTLTLRHATMDDVNRVLADLSAITRGDIGSHHLTDDEVRQRVDLYFKMGDVHVLLDGEEPLCVVGMCNPDDEWTCWLLATERFWTTRPSVWRMLRRYFADAIPAVGEDVHSYSGSPHPSLVRWMTALGFEHAAPIHNTQHFIYRA